MNIAGSDYYVWSSEIVVIALKKKWYQAGPSNPWFAKKEEGCRRASICATRLTQRVSATLVRAAIIAVL